EEERHPLGEYSSLPDNVVSPVRGVDKNAAGPLASDPGNINPTTPPKKPPSYFDKNKLVGHIPVKKEKREEFRDFNLKVHDIEKAKSSQFAGAG
ncbi:unnamed protein product, partial [Amoebophrya sp. A120]